MVLLLILCIAAVALWMVLDLAGRSQRSDPGTTVAEFSRALNALEQQRPGVQRLPARRGRRP
jgi:hypothetical protein